MAEQLQLIAKVVLDTQGANNDIKKLNANLETVKQTQEEIVALYGEQSMEAKQAAEAVSQIEAKLNEAKSAGQGIDEPVKSIKQQLREANAELQMAVDKFGAGSQEAANAATKVAKLKDTIGDAKTLTDAFNPDAKFKGLANAVQGAVGAITALQGAQALFGSQSKEVQETLVKVQGALALSQGINAVLEAKDAVKALGSQLMSLNVVQKIVTAAQYVWNLAMSANPIGAIIVAITALIAGITALISWLKASAAEAKAQAKAVEESTRAIENQSKALERNSLEFERQQAQQLAMAKASGMNAEAIRKLELKLADEKIAFEKSARATAYSTYEKERNQLASLKAADADDELIKKQEENLKKSVDQVNKQNEKIQKAYDDKVALQNRHEVELRQAQTDGENKRREDARQAIEKNKQLQENALKDRIERQKRFEAIQTEIDKATQENRLAQIEEGFYKQRLLIDTQYDANIEALLKGQSDELNALKEARKNNLISQSDYNTAVKKLQELTNEERKQIDIKYQLEVEKLNQKILEDRLKQEEDTFKFINDLRISKLKEGLVKEQELLALNQQNRLDALLKLLNDEAINQEEYNKRRLALNEQFEIENKALRDKYALKSINDQIAKLDAQVQSEDVAFSQRKDALTKEQELLDQAYANKLISDDAYTKATEKNKETREKIAKAEVNVYFNRAKQITDIIQGISELVKKDSKAAKAAAIAGLVIQQAQTVTQITTDTIKATKAISAKYSGVPGGQIPAAIEIGINVAQGALGIARAVAAVKKGIADIKGANESSAGGGGGGDLGGGAGGGAPLPPQPETTTLDQNQINQLSTANATVRAYVVESDVSGNQERITRLNRAARIS